MVTKARDIEKVAEQRRMTLTGNEAIAWGARLSRVPLTFHLPIGPADEVADNMGQFYSSGALKGKVMSLEGEDANFAAMRTAAGAGARTIFATTSTGLEKGLPCMASCAYARIPLLIPIPHRQIGHDGHGILAEWKGEVLLRESSWLLWQASSVQECLDLVPQIYKVIEDPSVHLPASLGYEGWEVSHSVEPVDVPAQEDIDQFLPPYRGPRYEDGGRLEWRQALKEHRGDNPLADVGETVWRYRLAQAMAKAQELFEEADSEWGRRFGRRWDGLVDASGCKKGDEIILVTMGSLVTTAQVAAELATELGTPTGVLKIRMFNPFPNKAVREALKSAKAVIALDRIDTSLLYNSLRIALYSAGPAPKVLGRILALAGESVSMDELLEVIEDGAKAARGEEVMEHAWLIHGAKNNQGFNIHPVA